MYKILFFLFIPTVSFGQIIDLGRIIDDKIAAFSNTLDSGTIKTAVSKTNISFNIDTLKIANNSAATFDIKLFVVAPTTLDGGSAHKEITIQNKNGVYKILKEANPTIFTGSGVTVSCSWAISVTSVGVVITCRPTANLINWKIKYLTELL